MRFFVHSTIAVLTATSIAVCPLMSMAQPVPPPAAGGTPVPSPTTSPTPPPGESFADICKTPRDLGPTDTNRIEQNHWWPQCVAVWSSQSIVATWRGYTHPAPPYCNVMNYGRTFVIGAIGASATTNGRVGQASTMNWAGIGVGLLTLFCNNNANAGTATPTPPTPGH